MNRDNTLHKVLEHMARILRYMSASCSVPYGSHALSRPQTDILFFVANSVNGRTVKELASLLNVTSGAITQFTNDLVNKKLIFREENTEDRRYVSLKLSPFAKKEFENFKKEYFKNINPIFSELKDIEIQSLLKLISKIDISQQKSK